MARYSKADVAESLARLRKLCPPGTTVYCTLRHVSRSGMLRRISLHVSRHGQIASLSWDAARVLGYPVRSRAGYVQDVGIAVGGCGMDMGFALVNALSYAIHGHKSRGADAIEQDNAGRPFTPRRGHFRAGYSLKHEWI